jgi:hypothetical protein
MAGLGSIPGPEHPAAPGGYGPLHIIQKFIQPGHGLGFAGPGLLAPGFPMGIAGQKPVPSGQGSMRRGPDRRGPA